MRDRFASVPAPLAALLAMAALVSAAWAFVMPPLQGPDELSHIAYVQRLAETHELPRSVTGDRYFSTETGPIARWENAPALIGNRNARPAFTELEQRRWEAEERALPAGSRADGTGPNPAGNNGPLYYLYAAVPYEIGSGGSFVDRLYLERLAGIVPLLAVIVFTWLLAGELLGGALWVRTLAAGSVALLPQLSFLSGVVNPDVFLAAIWSGFLWLAVITLKRGLTWPRLIGIGALCLASAATQARGLAILAPALVTVALAARHLFSTRRSKLLAAGGFAAATALMVVAALAFTPALDGAPFKTPNGQPFDIARFLGYTWQFYLPKLPFMDTSLAPPGSGAQPQLLIVFMGAFGWQEVLFPAWVYDLGRVLAIGGLLALVAAVVVRRVEVLRRWDVLAVLAVALVAPVLGLHVTEYLSYVTDSLGAVITGRYLLPLAPLFGLAIAFVASTLPRRYGPYLASAVLTGGALLTLGGLGATAMRFYA